MNLVHKLNRFPSRKILHMLTSSVSPLSLDQ